MGAFSFLTADGHKCVVGGSPEGFHLSIVPKEPPFEDEFLDVFYLGLKHGSAIRVLDAIQRCGSYVTRDKAASLSVRDGRCVLSFDSQHLPGRTFTCDLGEPGTAQLVELLSGSVAGSTEAIVRAIETPRPSVRDCPDFQSDRWASQTSMMGLG
jgi:hypothetical protein